MIDRFRESKQTCFGYSYRSRGSSGLKLVPDFNSAAHLFPHLALGPATNVLSKGEQQAKVL